MAKHEMIRTVRQEWQDFSDVVQDDVNETLRELTFEVAAANLRIAEEYGHDPAAAGQYAARAVEYFQSRWDYMGDHFMVTGSWHEPLVAMNHEGILAQHHKKEAFQPCISQGFAIMPLSDDEAPPQIGKSFMVADFPYASAVMRGQLQLFAYANLDEVSLQYMRPRDSRILTSDINEVVGAITRADSMLDLYANHDNSSFYRQSAKKQEDFLRSIIESVQDTLPAPDSMEKLIITEATTPELYMKNPTGNGLALLKAEQGGPLLSVSGHVVGVTIHDMLVDGPGMRYSSPDDLDSSKTGLSLMVKPTSASFGIENYDGSYFLLPMRELASMSLSLE